MNITSMCRGLLPALALTCLVAGTAHASVVYDQAYNTVGGYFSDPQQRLADKFSIAGGATVGSVQWWGNNFGGGPFASFTVSFYADSGNGPGALLASDIVTPTIVDTQATDVWGDILQFSADISDFSAAAGTSYYFSVVESVDNHFTWSRSNDTPDGWTSFLQGPWVVPHPNEAYSTAYALLTSVQSVPEPSSILLAGLAIASLVTAQARRHRRTQSAVTQPTY
jgi:hypothetical protein